MPGPALLLTLLLLIVSTGLGMASVRKLIVLHEARHELKQGSAGFLRAISGWSRIGVWLLVTWLAASVLGDWHRSGDPGGALERAQVRIYLVIEIVGAMIEADN